MKFLTVADIVEAHEIITAEDDDRPRVVNPAAIASALERARWGPFDVGDLAEPAAYLIRGLCQDHPFTNGNKRAAFAAADDFLLLNGYCIVAQPEEVVDFMLSVAQGEIELPEIAKWVRTHAEKL